MVGMHCPTGQKVKGQGRTVTKTIRVASDHVPYSVYQHAAVLPAAVAGVGLHVDTTAYVYLDSLFICLYLPANELFTFVLQYFSIYCCMSAFVVFSLVSCLLIGCEVCL